MQRRLNSLTLIAISAALTACGSSVESSAKPAVQCVDVPTGQYFQVVNGRLVARSIEEISAQERPFETATRISGTLAGMGYPWVDLDWDGETLTVSGLALDENTRSDAFISAKTLFETDPVAGELVRRIVNNMDVRDPVSAIAIRLSEELEGDGFGWMTVVMAGRVATLTGTAPNRQAKAEGYRAGRSTVESDLRAGERVNIVVDAIVSEEDVFPVGMAVAELTEGATAGECQDAFFEIMNGRFVEFEPGESVVKSGSSRLLDAATGVALLCETHAIEIEGHTNSPGDEAFNLDLSQRRASAVRDYLMAYGVEPEALTARGYGASRPSADDTNTGNGPQDTRTVFAVRPRLN
jgi:outer membrane protein OmpA-like peptidoglycan-associated protein